MNPLRTGCLLLIVAVAACACGGGSPGAAPSLEPLTVSPQPDPVISFLNGPDDAGHFHFDKQTFGLACEATLLASKEDRPAVRARDVATAAGDFLKLADLSGQYLALIVRQNTAAGFQRVLDICATNGADVEATGVMSDPRRSVRLMLTDRDLEILRFEKRRFRHRGAKDEAILRTFDLTLTRYYQRLNYLIDQPAALEAEPQLVRRLQRLRDQRARLRRVG